MRPGLDQPEVRPTANEGVGRRRHGLEADERGPGRREHLGERIAANDLELDAATTAGDDEAGRRHERVVERVLAARPEIGRVVERAGAQRPRCDRDRLARSGGKLAAVEHEPLGHRQLDPPVLAWHVGQTKVGMEPERHRDGEIAGGRERRVDDERVVDERDRHLELVREREGGEQARVGREREPHVETRMIPGRLLAHDVEARTAEQQAVDRQPCVVEVEHTGGRSERHAPAPHRIARAFEPVRPRVQQRDAHRRARAHVRRDAAARVEQLGAVVSQRAPDHPAADDERRLQAPAGRHERPGGEAVDRRLDDAGGRHGRRSQCIIMPRIAIG